MTITVFSFYTLSVAAGPDAYSPGKGQPPVRPAFCETRRIHMEKITTVLFDLDGTLLPMDQDLFVKSYFKRLAEKMAPRGYDPEGLIKAVWGGTAAMVQNDGRATNEEVFWDFFSSVYGEKALKDIPVFQEFYEVEFQEARQVCGHNPLAARSVALCRELGLRRVLATNPLFPSIATESRMRWAGVSPEDFEYYTTYENSVHCKPNPDYYRDILAHCGLRPQECLMVGNDVSEDMITETLGMKVFLLTDCLINKEGRDLSGYPRGGFEDLISYLEKLR